jgi:hypothetical protein
VAARCLEKYLGNDWQTQEPAIRSVFDVYLGRSCAVYIKENCGRVDLEARFFLHATPSDSSGVYRRDDFSVREAGYRIGNTCFAIVTLPDVDIIALRTGQVGKDGETLWDETCRLQDR